MKSRRHHNNKGYRQIQTGATGRFIARLARFLGVPVRGSTNTGAVAGPKSVTTNQQSQGATQDRLAVSNNRPFEIVKGDLDG